MIKGEANVYIALRPYRSLSSRGVIGIVGTVGIALSGIGLWFVSIGAWPVFGFLGLEFAVLWGALCFSSRTIGTGEDIHIMPDEFRLTRHPATENARSWSFNPAWLRLEFRADRTGRERLWVGSHGNWRPVGHFLPLPEQKALKKRLEALLDEVCRNPVLS